MGENSIKLVKINIDLISYVENIQFLTAFQCCFFNPMLLLMLPLVVQDCYNKLHSLVIPFTGKNTSL